MKKAVIFITVVALILVLTPTVIYAKNGPSEKVTGYIEFLQGTNEGYAEFNAHEEKGDKPAKGEFHRVIYNSGGSIKREIYVDITSVDVDSETTATFSGICTYDSRTTNNKKGQIFTVKVIDGGSPGTNGDRVCWSFDPNPTFDGGVYYEKPIIGGNLVVHSN